MTMTSEDAHFGNRVGIPSGIRVGHRRRDLSKYPGYRSNWSGKTNTCCPPKGLPSNIPMFGAPVGLAEPVDKPTSWRATKDTVAEPCYRGLYGITKSCKADLDVQILVCKSCSGCSAPPGSSSSSGGRNRHVHVNIRHMLKTQTEGCKAWFTLVDTGVRSFVANTRMQVVNNKIKKCKWGTKT